MEFLCSDEGQGLLEYAMIIMCVALVAIATLKFLGSHSNNVLNNAASSLS